MVLHDELGPGRQVCLGFFIFFVFVFFIFVLSTLRDQDLGEDLLEYLQGFKQLMFNSYKAWGRPIWLLCNQVLLEFIEKSFCFGCQLLELF